MPNLQSQRRAIVHFGKLLHARGYVAATDGNLSVRLNQQSILVTPTGVSKGMMRPQDLVVVDFKGHKLSGGRNVSSEIALHLLIYGLRNEVNAIIHAHPVVATGYAAAGITLDTALVSEAFIGLRALPLAPYATPGTPELSEAIRPLVRDHEAILMANHGVITYAEDLHHAYMKMELVEHFTMISLVTRLLGQQHPLTPQDLEKLDTRRRSKPSPC